MGMLAEDNHIKFDRNSNTKDEKGRKNTASQVNIPINVRR